MFLVHFLIGFIGLLSSVLAIASSFGIVGGIFGVKFNSVVQIAPFLLAGLGIDDMYVQYIAIFYVHLYDII